MSVQQQHEWITGEEFGWGEPATDRAGVPDDVRGVDAEADGEELILNIVKERQAWISPEEFGREYRGLVQRDVSFDAPEFQALFERLAERDEWLFEEHGKSYLQSDPGKWW